MKKSLSKVGYFGKLKENFGYCTEVPISSFFSGEFITLIILNPSERKLAKRTTVQCTALTPKDAQKQKD